MPKTNSKNEMITAAAREAGQKIDAFRAVEIAARKIVDAQRSEALSGTFVGIHIIGGRIKDVVANNVAIKIEE